MKDSNKQLTFVDVINEETYDSVLRLDKKLRGLLVVVKAQIAALSDESDQTLVSRRTAQLTALSEEVEQALVNIEQLVNLVAGEEVGISQDEQFNSEDLAHFYQTIQDGLEKLGHLQMKSAF